MISVRDQDIQKRKREREREKKETPMTCFSLSRKVKQIRLDWDKRELTST